MLLVVVKLKMIGEFMNAKEFFIKEFEKTGKFKGDEDLKFTQITARWAIELAEKYYNEMQKHPDKKTLKVVFDWIRSPNCFITNIKTGGKDTNTMIDGINLSKYINDNYH